MPSTASPPGMRERFLYYYGLPSRPVLVARSSTFEWFDTHTWPQENQIKNVGPHQPLDQWEALQEEIIVYLNAHSLTWTCLDVVRIGPEGRPPPIVLWIGVKPATLSGEEGVQVALACKEILNKHQFFDVECEIREANRIQAAGPKLMRPTGPLDPTTDIRVSFSASLGTSISTKAFPHVEGSLGFYATSGGKLFGLTARHVLFPPLDTENEPYEQKYTSQRRHYVTLPGDMTISKLIKDTENKVIDHKDAIDVSQRAINTAKGRKGDDYQLKLKFLTRQREHAQEDLLDLESLAKTLKLWKPQDNRVIGHAVLSPPLCTGNHPHIYTIDWCMYEIDTKKLDVFSGNVIDLGNKYSSRKYVEVMNPNIKNPHKFTVPDDRQLQLQGTIPISEMRQPRMLDKDGSPCFLVMKRGRTTDMTFGIGNEILSYTRNYFLGGPPVTAKEWPILSYSKDSGPFSVGGDSGAVVFDAKSRIGGMITAGAGVTDTTDITYVTPMDFLLAQVETLTKNKVNIDVGEK